MLKQFKGIVFDDFVERYDDHEEWSQICQSCVDKNNIDKFYLDDVGSGVCGVEGCNNESDYYIDFPKEELIGTT